VIATTSGTLAQSGLSSGYHGTTTISSGATLSLGTATISGGITSLNGGGVGTITFNGSGLSGLGTGGTLVPGDTVTNNTNNPITIGGVTIPAHGSVTIPH
jgi:hypothetical protein